jgi:predicted phage gp36 major capsid-like protein
VSTGVLSCNALFSRMSSEKPFITILAAIGSQEKKRENGALQEVLPARRSHIRAVTHRAGSCSPHKTTSTLSLCRARKKCKEKWVIAWEANQAGRTLINGSGQLHVAPDQSHSTTCRVSINAVRSMPTTSTCSFVPSACSITARTTASSILPR